MKVAVICTGHPRTYKRCITNWKGGLKDTYDADFYFGMWNEDGKLKGVSINRYDDFDKTIVPKEQILNDLCPTLTSENNILYLNYEYHDGIVLDYLQRYDVHSMPHGRTERWHQWYLMQKTYNLIKKSGIEYDVIVRLRPDTVLVGIPKLKKFEKIQVATGGLSYPSDYFFYGPQNLMEKLCNLYDILPEILLLHREKDIYTRVGLDEHETLRWLYQTNRIPAEHNTDNFVILLRENMYHDVDDIAYFLNENFAEELKIQSQYGSISFLNLNWDKNHYFQQLYKLL